MIMSLFQISVTYLHYVNFFFYQLNVASLNCCCCAWFLFKGENNC